MLRKVILYFLISIILPIYIFAGTPIKSVAVTGFTANGFSDTQSWIGESCADVIIDRISTDRSVRIVERVQLNKILEELRLQMGGLVNSDAVVETGNLLGVTYFITGNISLFDEQIILSDRVFSVETGEIISTSTIRGPLKDLFRLQENLAQKISDDLAFKIQLTGTNENALTNFETYQKIEYLKRMAATLPEFSLDPRRKIRTNEYLNSIRECDDLIKSNPAFYLPHYYKGIFSMHLGEYEVADKESNLAVKLATVSFDPLILRALVFINSGRVTEAKEILDLITSGFPDQPEGWFLMSKIYDSQNNRSGATESLLRSVLSSSIIPQALTNLRSSLGMTQLAESDFSDRDMYKAARLFTAFWSKEREPADIIKSAVELSLKYPGFYLPYYFTGRSELRNKNFAAAAETLQNCISLNPSFPEAHRDLAICYYNMNFCNKAETHSKLYLQISDAVTDYSIIEEAKKKCKQIVK
jgi:TolB-like protein